MSLSLMHKAIIPLLDKELTKDDLREDIGFVGSYTYDKNRPWLDEHFFLMYDINKNPEENAKREQRFEKHTNIANVCVEQIGGKMYKIYAYWTGINPDIKRLKLVREKPSLLSNASRIAIFWQGEDRYLSSFLFAGDPMGLEVDWPSVPEFDHRPNDPLGWNPYG